MSLPTSVTRHKETPIGSNHTVVSWIFSQGASPSITPLVATDLYKIALRTSDNTPFILVDYTTPNWIRLPKESEVILQSEKGISSGVATLDEAGLVPSTQLPSYVDDVLEYADSTEFPATGETGKIYIAIDTKQSYRWSGTEYFEIGQKGLEDHIADTTAHSAIFEDQVFSAGLIDPPTYDVELDDTVTINACCVSLYDNSTFEGIPKKYDLIETNITLTDLTTNYIVADYNNGEPVIRNSTNVLEITESDIIPIFTIVKNGTTLNSINWDSLGLGLVNKIHQSIVKTQRYRREYGLSLTETGTREVIITEGKVYIGANPILLSAIDTSDSDDITFCYHDSGDWTYSTITAYNNTQYDDGTDLQTLSNNRFTVNWVYRGVEDNKSVYILLGTEDYTSTEAIDALPPTPPTRVSSHAVLISKIIVGKSLDVASSITSAFEKSFVSSSATNHNDLLFRDAIGNHEKLIPLADGTTAVQITKADGTTVILNVDSTDQIVSINGSTNDGSTNVLELYNSDSDLIYKIDSNGFKKIEWKDEYVAGEWVPASGATAPTLTNVTIGGVDTRKYFFVGANTTEAISNSFEINHDVDIDSLNDETVAIEWHVHSMPSSNNAGNAKWILNYCYVPLDGAPIPQVDLTCIIEIEANQQYYHLLCGEDLPKPAGGYGIGDIIIFTLKRVPTDDEDTYPDDIILIKTALHVPVNSSGSRQRYIK